MHRRHVVKAYCGAAHRIQLERLPAYAPERHPGEWLWAHLKWGERRYGCGVNLPHPRAALREAVTRLRRTPRLIQAFVRGAQLDLCMSGAVNRSEIGSGDTVSGSAVVGTSRISETLAAGERSTSFPSFLVGIAVLLCVDIWDIWENSVTIWLCRVTVSHIGA
jgi:hypothetical protein